MDEEPAGIDVIMIIELLVLIVDDWGRRRMKGFMVVLGGWAVVCSVSQDYLFFEYAKFTTVIFEIFEELFVIKIYFLDNLSLTVDTLHTTALLSTTT